MGNPLNYKTYKLNTGYVVRCWWANGKQIHKYEHRAVWEDNFGTIPEGYVVYHKDGNKSNNHISNLGCMSRGKHSAMVSTRAINNKNSNCVHCGRLGTVSYKLCGRCAQHKRKYGSLPSLKPKPTLCLNCGYRIPTRKGLCHSCYQVQWQQKQRAKLRRAA